VTTKGGKKRPVAWQEGKEVGKKKRGRMQHALERRETDTHTPSLDGFPQKLSAADGRHSQTLVYEPVRVCLDYDLV
jgi:hypothetical protein